jgi:hypothetical protein
MKIVKLMIDRGLSLTCELAFRLRVFDGSM